MGEAGIMITDLEQRRIPKRRDRFNLELVIVGTSIAILFVIWFYPEKIYPIFGGFFNGFIIILLGLSILGGLYQLLSWRTAWEHIAEQSDLTYELYKPKQSLIWRWPRISGIYKGRAMRMERFMRGSGKYAKNFTQISIGLNGDPNNWLEITPKNRSSRLRKTLSFKKKQLEVFPIDDEIFDNKLEVRSQPDDFARMMLASLNLRQALLELRAQAPNLKLAAQADVIYYHEQSTIKDAEYLQAVLDLLVEFAGYVERYSR